MGWGDGGFVSQVGSLVGWLDGWLVGWSLGVVCLLGCHVVAVFVVVVGHLPISLGSASLIVL